MIEHPRLVNPGEAEIPVRKTKLPHVDKLLGGPSLLQNGTGLFLPEPGIIETVNAVPSMPATKDSQS
jgi:hypothetical protein